jgi:hypothetical protein
MVACNVYNLNRTDEVLFQEYQAAGERDSSVVAGSLGDADQDDPGVATEFRPGAPTAAEGIAALQVTPAPIVASDPLLEPAVVPDAEADELETVEEVIARGGTVILRVSTCAAPLGDDVPSTGFYHVDLGEYAARCPTRADDIDVTLDGPVGELTATTVGGGVEFTGLEAGPYVLAAAIPAGSSASPAVFCEGVAPGRAYDENHLFQATIAGGAFVYDLAPGEGLVCNWFNIPAEWRAPAGDRDNATGDLDTDLDRLSDAEEAVIGTDPANPDTDWDGLADYDELAFYDTDPWNPDTDADGLLDGDEVWGYGSDPLRHDTDGDLAGDGDEVYVLGTDPTIVDNSTGGGLGYAGGVEDAWTMAYTDFDGDGLTAADEAYHGTDPYNADSDYDGTTDGDEISYGTSPLYPDGIVR